MRMLPIKLCIHTHVHVWVSNYEKIHKVFWMESTNKINNVHSSMYKCILDGATSTQAARTTSPTMGHTEKLKRKLADLG